MDDFLVLRSPPGPAPTFPVFHKRNDKNPHLCWPCMHPSPSECLLCVCWGHCRLVCKRRVARERQTRCRCKRTGGLQLQCSSWLSRKVECVFGPWSLVVVFRFCLSRLRLPILPTDLHQIMLVFVGTLHPSDPLNTHSSTFLLVSIIPVYLTAGCFRRKIKTKEIKRHSPIVQHKLPSQSSLQHAKIITPI